MNSDQAREILLRYRAGTSDELDPEVQAALEQASHDPQLAAWLDDHGKFQQQVQDEFRRLKVPEGLREQILSEKRVRLSPWRSPRRLAVCALAAALLVFGFFIWMDQKPDAELRFATFRSRMVKTVLRGYAMDIETNDTAQIRRYLATRQAYPDWQSPPGLKSIPVMGCAVMRWHSQPAAMICYGTGATPQLWLFVVDTSALPDPPGKSARVVSRVNRLNTVSWSSQGKTYVLAGERDKAELLRLLAGQG